MKPKSKKPKVLYMIQMNLSGLHDCVYKLKWNEDAEGWYDSSGNIAVDDLTIGNPNVLQLTFTTYREAEAALKGAKMYQRGLKNFLGE